MGGVTASWHEFVHPYQVRLSNDIEDEGHGACGTVAITDFACVTAEDPGEFR